MNPRRPWITDPHCIDTICALGLPAGSEVKLQKGEEIDIGTYYDPERAYKVGAAVEDRRFFGRAYGRNGSGRYVKWKIIATAGSWYICRENIAAWRAPKQKRKEVTHG